MAAGKEVACRTVTRVAASFGGDDLFVSEYVESEFLSRISRQDRAFLARTAVLERMCGPLCDLTGRLVLPTYRQGRVTTVQRWFVAARQGRNREAPDGGGAGVSCVRGNGSADRG